MYRKVTTLLLAGALAGCNGDSGTSPQPDGDTFEFDFAQQTHGWIPGFADYPVGREEDFALESGHEPLPDELERTGGGLFIAGTNLSDDLFMFWKREVSGLEPETRYRVGVEVEFATAAPSGCAGIGGPPGESVFVKAGASTIEPEPVVEDEPGGDVHRMNIDKGNQSQGGEDAVVIGNIANTNTDCANPRWETKTLTQDDAVEVTSASDGTAWLIVGTDSGFEGRTAVSYTRIRADFEPI